MTNKKSTFHLHTPTMDRNFVNKVYLKLRDRIEAIGYGGGIPFDSSSYDDVEDMPHITHNGERRRVTFFQARGKETIAVVLYPYWHEVLININYMDAEELFNLLRDVYYEIEMDDFEEDFCKNIS